MVCDSLATADFGDIGLDVPFPGDAVDERAPVASLQSGSRISPRLQTND